MRPVPDASSTPAGTLRLWRERAAPPELGLNDGPPRRAARLRREELAEAAGLSVDDLVRLEQGRATGPSIPVVAALARGLRRSRDERDHLYGLAGFQPPNDRTIAHDVPPAVLRLVKRLGGEVAVAVFDADWRLVWWSET